MATELYTAQDGVYLTRFFGGTERGACIQLTETGASFETGRTNYVRLTPQQAAIVGRELIEFAEKGTTSEDIAYG